MAKTNSIKKFVNGEIIDADDVNQVIENSGAEGGVIPYNESSHNRDTTGQEDIGSVNYPFGDIYFNKDKKFKSVNTGTAAVDQEFTFAEIMQFIKKTDTPSNYSGSGEKFLRVNSGENAVEFATSPDKSSMNHSIGFPIISSNAGLLVGQSTFLGAVPVSSNYSYLGLNMGGLTTNYYTVYQFEWQKIAGVTTVLVRAKIWQDFAATSRAGLQVDIGGQTGNVLGSAGRQTPEKVSFTVDVSALSDNTIYDAKIQLKGSEIINMNYVYLAEISLIGQ